MKDLATSEVIKIEPKYYLLAVAVSLGNTMFYNDLVTSMAIVTLEILVLLYYLIKGDLIEYICYYMIFLAPCIEFGSFVSNDSDLLFYGFKNFRIMGLNLGLIFIIIPIIYIVLMKKINTSLLKKYKNMIFLIKCLLFLIICATIMGILNILLNDNFIQNMPNYWVRYFEQAYENYWVLMVVLVAFYSILGNESKLYKLENSLLAILISSAIVLLFSASAGYYGSYATLKTLLAPTVSWFIPFLLLIPFYDRFKNIKIIILIIGIVGTYLLLLNNSNGKILILFAMIIVIGLVLYIKKNQMQRFLPIVLICLVIFSFSSVFIEKYTNENQLLKNKYQDAYKLISIWDDNWLVNMPNSPKFRISEGINVLIEYSNKPLQVIFGKGYLGTTKDYIEGFGWNQEGAFTTNQYTNGTFYALHETANELFLKNGLIGLIILFMIIKRTIFKFHKNIWLLIGGIWFGLLYGFSLTLSVFGILSLVLGLIQLDLKTETKLKPLI